MQICKGLLKSKNEKTRSKMSIVMYSLTRTIKDELLTDYKATVLIVQSDKRLEFLRLKLPVT